MKGKEELSQTSKIINSKSIAFPNVHLFSKKMDRFEEENDKKEKEKMKEIDELNAKAKFDSKIHIERYNSKIRSLENRTILFKSLENLTDEKKMITFYKNEEKRVYDIPTLQSKITEFASRTFDNSMKLNFKSDERKQLIRTEKDMDRELKRKKEELEGFKVYFF